VRERDAAQQPRDASRADDGPGAAWHHDARGVLDARHRGAGVHRHDAVEVGQVQRGHGDRCKAAADPGVAEHHVEAAVERHGQVHRRRDLRLVGHVAAGVVDDRGGGGVLFRVWAAAQLCGDGVAQVVLDVREDDLGAVPDELRRRRPADSARAAGDQRHLSSQPSDGGTDEE